MDFDFTPEQSQFRDELREFLRAEVPVEKQEVFGQWSEDQCQFGREINRKLAARNWLAIGLPEEYGGGGKRAIEQGILAEELGYGRVSQTGFMGLGQYGSVRRLFDDFTDFCNDSAPDGGQPVAEHPLVRHQLAQRRLGMETWKFLCWRAVWLQSVGSKTDVAASITFLHGTEEQTRFAEMAMEVLGPYSTLRHGSSQAPLLGNIEGLHREAMNLQGAETTVMHRNIIAHLGLGMPYKTPEQEL